MTDLTERPQPIVPNIIITDSAAQKVANLLEEENNPLLKFRAFVQGGGCSGLQYGFTFDEAHNADDFMVEKTITLNSSGKTITIILLVDSLSFQYLAGATIDYEETPFSASFIIKNPNAASTCGCGSSFAV